MINPFARWRGRSRVDAGAAPDAKTSPEAGTGKKIEPATIQPEEYVGRDQAANEAAVRAGFVAKAKRYLRHLPMAESVVAMYFCMLDAKTPLWVKGVAAAALAYFILPLDAVPDLLPLVGLSDDATVLTAALTTLAAYITAEHHRQAAEWLAHEGLIAAPKT